MTTMKIRTVSAQQFNTQILFYWLRAPGDESEDLDREPWSVE